MPCNEKAVCILLLSIVSKIINEIPENGHNYSPQKTANNFNTEQHTFDKIHSSERAINNGFQTKKSSGSLDIISVFTLT